MKIKNNTHTVLIQYIIYFIFGLLLFGCTDVGGTMSGNSNNTLSANPLEITPLPVIQIKSTQNTIVPIPVFNNTDQIISDIDYVISTDVSSDKPVILNQDMCEKINPHAYCLINILIPTITDNQSKGAFTLKVFNDQHSAISLIQYKTTDYKGVGLFIPPQQSYTLPSPSSYFTTYIYNFSDSQDYYLDSLNLTGGQLINGSKDIMLAHNSLTPIIIKNKAGNENNKLSINATYSDTPVRLAKSTRLADDLNSLNSELSVFQQDGAILLNSYPNVINTKTSQEVEFTIFNYGNQSVTLQSINSSNANIQIETVAGSCQTSTPLSINASCKIHYRVIHSLNSGSAKITITSNSTITPTLDIDTGWYNSDALPMVTISSEHNNSELNTRIFDENLIIKNTGGFVTTNGALSVSYKTTGITATIDGYCIGTTSLSIGEQCDSALHINYSGAVGPQLVQLKYDYIANGENRTQYYNYYFSYYDTPKITLSTTGLDANGQVLVGNTFNVIATLSGGNIVPDQTISLQSPTPADGNITLGASCVVNTTTPVCTIPINVGLDTTPQQYNITAVNASTVSIQNPNVAFKAIQPTLFYDPVNNVKRGNTFTLTAYSYPASNLTFTLPGGGGFTPSATSCYANPSCSISVQVNANVAVDYYTIGIQSDKKSAATVDFGVTSFSGIAYIISSTFNAGSPTSDAKVEVCQFTQQNGLSNCIESGYFYTRKLYSAVIVPTGKYFYLGSAGNSPTSNDGVYRCPVDQADGKPQSSCAKQTITNDMKVFGMTISRNYNYLYYSDAPNDKIYKAAIAADGTLSGQVAYAPGLSWFDQPERMVMNDTGNLLYVSLASYIGVCTVNTTDGNIESCVQTTIATPANTRLYTPAFNNNYSKFYVGGGSPNSTAGVAAVVTVCDYNKTTGALSNCVSALNSTSGIPNALRVSGIAFSSSYAFLTTAGTGGTYQCPLNSDGTFGTCTAVSSSSIQNKQAIFTMN